MHDNIFQKLQVLKPIAEDFNKLKINWGIGASLLLYFKGIVSDFNDIDIMVALEDTSLVEEVFNKYGQLKPQTNNQRFKSDFFKTYIVDGLEFDVIGGFRIVATQTYYFPFEGSKQKYDLSGTMIPLDDIFNWIEYYNLMGRPHKAQLICDFYAKQLNDYLKQCASDNIISYQRHVIPNSDQMAIIGVSLPKLRKIAKQIAKKYFVEFTKINQHQTLENLLLEGMVIGYYRTTLANKFELITNYLPLINNWETCDTFAASLKFDQAELPEVYHFIKQLKCSSNPYAIRWMLVMMINHFNQQMYYSDLLHIIDDLKNTDYYVQMAIAWLLAEIYAKDHQLVLDYLATGHLDDFTYNKTLQKICESLKTDPNVKASIRKLKR